MKQVGDYVVYRRDVCKVVEIKKNYMKGNDYYRLTPINDESLHLDIPVNSDMIRELISLEDIKKLLDKIPNISPIENNDRIIENIYKELINNGNLEGYIKIIKTTYLRNKKRIANRRRLSEKDSYYFNLAENYLYNEFSIVLNKSFDDVKEYVIPYFDKN